MITIKRQDNRGRERQINKKVVVVMPAYNAEKTLEQTYNEIPFDIVDEVILTDDCSKDNTVQKAKELGINHIIVHDKNKGYGGNQKTCYNKALEIGGGRKLNCVKAGFAR